MQRVNIQVVVVVTVLAALWQAAALAQVTPPAMPQPPMVPSLPPTADKAAQMPVPPLPLPPQPQANTPASAADAKKQGTSLGALMDSMAPKPAEEPAQPVPTRQFSYGSSNLSILFLPATIERMKESIRTYESQDNAPKPTTFVEPAPTLQAVEKINEPASYPVFYLSSIAYDTPGEWSVWVSGHKITSRQNNTDLKIVGVTRDSVTFIWSPAYSEAIRRRRESDQFADISALKNKLAVIQNISQDESTRAITFSLRQNQTFAVGYFSIFEGYVDTPKLAPLAVTAAGPAAGMDGSLGNQPDGAMPPGMNNQPEPGALPPGMNAPGGASSPSSIQSTPPGMAQQGIPKPPGTAVPGQGQASPQPPVPNPNRQAAP